KMLDVRATSQVISFLKMSGHSPEYGSFYERFNTSTGKLFMILGGIIALFLCIYLYIIPTAADIFARHLPESYEINLGNRMYRQIITNDSIDTVQTDLANRFAKQINFETDYPIQITVVHGHEVNAFATPGGHIIVYDTLLNQLENPDELAALLSHEATHIKERHSLRALASDLSRSLFLSILFHDQNSISAVIVENADMLNSLRFSREMEQVADEGAIKTMLDNNIDPEGMVQLLKLLKQEEKNANGNLTYLSTHPATNERIADVEKFIDNYNIRIIQNKDRNRIWKELNKKSKK
ncbi:MAG: M48 family metallopeptidase, partial [Bacteroidota bacterium]|nr:M48 family metallopeptidase [Bacteroidota bacterium]